MGTKMPATKKYEDKSPRSLKQKIYDENRPKSSTAIYRRHSNLQRDDPVKLTSNSVQRPINSKPQESIHEIYIYILYYIHINDKSQQINQNNYIRNSKKNED